MTKEQNLRSIGERAVLGPKRTRKELAEIAREIEKARRKGVYVMDDEERTAVARGVLEQARRGEFVSDEKMDGFLEKEIRRIVRL